MNQNQLNLLNLTETPDGLFCAAEPVCRIYQVVFGEVDFRNLFFEGTLEQLDDSLGLKDTIDEYEFILQIDKGLFRNLTCENISVFYRDFVSKDDIDEYARLPMDCELFPDRLI